MTDEPDLDMAITRRPAEIAGVLNEAAGLRADLAVSEFPTGRCTSYVPCNGT